MKKNKAVGFLLTFVCLSIFSFGQSLPEKPNPPRLVNDYANMLSPSQERALESKLVAYNDSTSTQILVILVNDLGEYPISEFSYEIGDKWGVGQTGKDNGLVITVAKAERETFIATGWGLEEYITDVTASRLVDGVLIPNFKQGNFYKGLDQTTTIVIQLLEGNFKSDRLNRESSGIPLWVIVLIIIIVFILLSRNSGSSGGQINRRGWSGPIIIGGGNSSGSFGGGSFGGGGGFGGFGGGSFGGGGAGGSW